MDIMNHNSTYNSWQAHVGLRRCTANSEYLQHGGVYYRRQMATPSTAWVYFLCWRRGSLVTTPVFGWRTFLDLRM